MRRVTRLGALTVAGLMAAGLMSCGGGGDGGGGCGAPIVDIAPDSSTAGTLASGDCTIQQILGADDQSLADRYRVTLTSTGTLTILMESTEVDAFLGLFDSNMTLLAIDDDSGGFPDAQITAVDLLPGTYIILANSAFVTPQTGAYTLTTSFVPTVTVTALGVEAADLPAGPSGSSSGERTEREEAKRLIWGVDVSR